MKVKLLSRVQLFTTPWTEAHQAPPSMGFSRQEYWSGVPLPSPEEGAGVSLFDHNGIKSCASVFGHQDTSYSWLSGFRGMCHVPKQKSLWGIPAFPVAADDCVQAFRNRASSQFKCL